MPLHEVREPLHGLGVALDLVAGALGWGWEAFGWLRVPVGWLEGAFYGLGAAFCQLCVPFYEKVLTFLRTGGRLGAGRFWLVERGCRLFFLLSPMGSLSLNEVPPLFFVNSLLT